MCVLAAYIGPKSAAPILLEMLEKQEGLGGGFYSGIATIHDGSLYYKKVVGDVAALRKETSAELLPGTIGIAHSRTPSGGDKEWAHPFVDCAGRMAYVAQGSRGFFKDRSDMKAAGDKLVAKGHAFRAVSNDKVGSYPVLSDGTCVHISDIMCHAIEDALVECGDRLEAMRQAYMKWPGEIVGMSIHQDDPEHIIAACVNQPLVIGRDEPSTYMASTSLALPDSASWRMHMPPNAATAISGDGLEVRPFDSSAQPVDVNCPCAEAEAMILDHLAKEPGSRWGSVAWSLTKSLWPEGHLVWNAPMAYVILERLYRAGRLRFETLRVPGMFNRGTVPQVKVYLK